MSWSIITKRGDEGETDCLYGRRVHKSDELLEVIGNLDELNAWIGYAQKETDDGWGGNFHLEIQKDLTAIMGEISAGPDYFEKYKKNFDKVVTEENIAKIEKIVHGLEKDRKFTDWANPESSWDIACRVCRRAERSMHRYCNNNSKKQFIKSDSYIILKPIRKEILVYINRLSDLLWIWGRK